ncbi:MAG: 2-oxo-hept-4-ene-1,7-dioate hydratase [Actinomycetota bacterium]
MSETTEGSPPIGDDRQTDAGADQGFDSDAAATEAARLDEAERTATQMSQTTGRHPDLTLDDAYRIQAAWRSLRLARGERVIGHKIGLTSRAMQAAMQIETPDSGFLTDAMVFEPGTELAASTFCDPKLEVELAFVLGQDLDRPDLTVDDVLAATDHVVPALELIAARSHRRDPATGRARTVVDTVADNAANAGIITGGRAVAPTAIDLRWAPALLYRNGVVEETGVAAGVLDHPANGIVWLARRYAQQGLRLEAGQTILAGSFTRPVDVRPGDVFRADYHDLGTFEIAFR